MNPGIKDLIFDRISYFSLFNGSLNNKIAIGRKKKRKKKDQEKQKNVYKPQRLN